MRKFYLENSIGERKPLNGEIGIYFQNPAGLGMVLNPSFADNKRGFFVKVSGDIEPQGEIVGDLVFFRNGDPYENYRDFINWISQGYDLHFVYKPYGTAEFYRTVDVNRITKTEKQSLNTLSSPVSFACLTPWFSLTPSATAISPALSAYKRYPYTYPYVYPAARQNSAVQVSAIGHLPAAYTLQYTGLLINPTIKLMGVGSRITYGECDISATVESTDTLFYSCGYRDAQVYKTAADGSITDLIGSVDIAKEVFGRIPLSEPCEIVLTSSAAITNTAAIKVYNYYRSV